MGSVVECAGGVGEPGRQLFGIGTWSKYVYSDKCQHTGTGLTASALSPAKSAFTIQARDQYGNARTQVMSKTLNREPEALNPRPFSGGMHPFLVCTKGKGVILKSKIMVADNHL